MPLRARQLLFLIFAIWTTGSLGAASFSFGAAGVIDFSEAQGFGPKLQWGGSGIIGVVIPLAGWLSIVPGFDYAYIAPSDVSGGFAYRGFQAGSLSVMLQAQWLLAALRGFGELSGGAAFGGAAAISVYTDTTLYFFFPEARFSPFIEWRPAFLPSIGFALALPVKMQFRRDMTSSLAAGLELDIVYALGKAK
jgi:hypothetical protein